MKRSDLSVSNKQLLKLMWRIYYGSIKGLIIKNGDPVLNPLPHMESKIKFSGDNGPRPEATKKDFMLKMEVRDLFAKFEAMGDGVVASIEIQRGLPVHMTIEGCMPE